MCSPFSCGSFENWKEYDELPTPIKSPNKSSSKSFRSFSFSVRSSSRRSNSKNPFANQGLDKFSALLADIDAKKQKIYTQKGSEDISLVYFTYTNKSDEFRPFIVKVKKQSHPPPPPPQIKKSVPATEVAVNNNNHNNTKDSMIRAAAVTATVEKNWVKNPTSIRKTNYWSFELKSHDRHIFSYFAVTIILILVLLAFGGRSFAVVCVTAAWYLVPVMLSTEKTNQVPKTNDKNRGS